MKVWTAAPYTRGRYHTRAGGATWPRHDSDVVPRETACIAHSGRKKWHILFFCCTKTKQKSILKQFINSVETQKLPQMANTPPRFLLINWITLVLNAVLLLGGSVECLHLVAAFWTAHTLASFSASIIQTKPLFFIGIYWLARVSPDYNCVTWTSVIVRKLFPIWNVHITIDIRGIFVFKLLVEHSKAFKASYFRDTYAATTESSQCSLTVWSSASLLAYWDWECMEKWNKKECVWQRGPAKSLEMTLGSNVCSVLVCQ